MQKTYTYGNYIVTTKHTITDNTICTPSYCLKLARLPTNELNAAQNDFTLMHFLLTDSALFTTEHLAPICALYGDSSEIATALAESINNI